MKNLAHLCLAILFFSLAHSSMGQEQAKILKQTRKVDVFFQVLISGQYDVVLRAGDAPGLVLEGTESDLDAVHMEVKSGTLMIFTTRQIPPDSKVKAIITYQDLRKMKLAGSIKLTTEGSLVSPSLQLDVSGNSEIDMPLHVTELVIQMSGEAIVTIKGEVENMTTALSGNSELHALKLQTASSQMLMEGSTKAWVYAASSLNANLSGHAKLVYDGSPEIIERLEGKAQLTKWVQE